MTIIIHIITQHSFPGVFHELFPAHLNVVLQSVHANKVVRDYQRIIKLSERDARKVTH